MRTEYFNRFERKSSEINNYICFIKFTTEQFFNDHLNEIRENPKLSFGQYFDENRYSSKFDVQFERFSQSIDQYKQKIWESSFILLYSVFDIFLEELLDFYIGLLNKEGTQKKGKSKIEILSDIVDQTSEDIVGADVLNTYNYLRLRRNSTVHLEGNLSEDLKKIIKAHD